MSTISCDDCGACCMGENLLPLLGWTIRTSRGPRKDPRCPMPADEWKRLKRIAKSPRVGLRNWDNPPCIWLDRDTGKCMHYEWRPPVCHEVVCGDESCQHWRAQAGMTILM